MDREEIAIRLDQETRTTPYESPIVVLSVGQKEENPVLFYVHKERLIHIPFFKAAFREDAFIEGRQNKIEFEDDPILFRRLVEFIYEGDFFPRKKSLPTAPFRLESPLMIKGPTVDCKEKEYAPSVSGRMLSGLNTTTAETHQLLVMVTQLMCLADRYGMDDLVGMCFEKLKHFSIGTSELTVLAEYIIRNIPDTRVSIHEFLADRVSLYLPHLRDSEAFQKLLESEMTLVGQGLMRLTINAATSSHKDKNS